MIADGCLDGVDQIFGMHVWPPLATGSIGVHEGPTMARPDTFRIRLRGVGGHAAAPQHNRDVVVGASQIVIALQSIVARNIDPLESAVLSVTQVHTGTADNVIPEQAIIRGTIRSFEDSIGDRVRRRLEEVSHGIAAALELDASVEHTLGYPVLVNDPAACAAATSAIEGTVQHAREVDPSLGGEDFAYYLEKIPGAFLFLGNYDEAQDIRYFCHHPKFRVDDAAMGHGLRAWVALGTRLPTP